METKDFRKIAKKCVKKLQKLQMSVIFDQNISMQIDTGWYMGSFDVCVFIGAHELGAKRRLVKFDFSPWHSKKDIENKLETLSLEKRKKKQERDEMAGGRILTCCFGLFFRDNKKR